MKESTLIEYVSRHGQTSTARALGLTQGSVWQMLKSGREVVIREADEGMVTFAFERKPIGRFRRETA